jgi:DNA-binding IclR family transcriptional regulator
LRALNQSLDRGLDVLELLDASEQDVGVRDVARKLGLSPAIVQRLINTLCERGYLLRDGDTRRYRLGYRSIGLGSDRARSGDVVSLAQSELRRLTEQHRVNAFLGTLKEGRAVYLVTVQGDGPIAIRAGAGEQMPLHSTAIGKVLLASLDGAVSRMLLGKRKLQRITERTITDPDKLLRSLDRIRSQGFATVREENLPGVLSVGAPIRDAGGSVVAAVSVAYPRSLDPALSLEAMTPHVVKVAERISRRIGWLGEASEASGGRLDAAE